MAARTRLSTRGQIVLPKEVRERHGWRPGLEFVVEDREDSVVLRPIAPDRPTTVDDLLGCLPWRGRAKTLEEMEAGIARGARAHR